MDQNIFIAARKAIYEIKGNSEVEDIKYIAHEIIEEDKIVKVLLEYKIRLGNQWKSKRITVQLEKRKRVIGGEAWDYSHRFWE